MAKQVAITTGSFDKFQEKEAFSGILPEGISQNIILRVFKTPRNFFLSILLQIHGKRGWFFSEHSNSPEHQNDFFGVFLGDLFIFMDWSEAHYIFQETFPVEGFFPFGYRESYSHNRWEFFAVESLVNADYNSSDTYGLGYQEHL